MTKKKDDAGKSVNAIDENMLFKKITRREAIKRAATGSLLIGSVVISTIGADDCSNYYSVPPGAYRSCCYYSHEFEDHQYTYYDNSGLFRIEYVSWNYYYCSCP